MTIQSKPEAAAFRPAGRIAALGVSEILQIGARAAALRAEKSDQRDIAWLYLTPNPWHNPAGDFALDLYTLANEGDPKWNFAGIGVYRPEMFDGVKAGDFLKFGPLMRKFIEQKRVGGEIYHGPWVNVGTVGPLEEVLFGPGHHTNGTSNLIGALRRSMATTGYSDLKEFQRVDVVVSPYAGN